VNSRDAVDLLRGAIHTRGGTWADLGAGSGVFTRALVELLGAESRVYAVDREARVATTRNVIAVNGDFTRPFELPGLGAAKLDGILLANSLHFVRDAQTVLTALVARVKVHGSVVLVEYDRRAASRWVPFPIACAELPKLAEAAGLSPFEVTATRPSDFGGELYVASAQRNDVAYH
jgi:ubiquinone/menaquinone biosynthesis C-methylase UbiE